MPESPNVVVVGDALIDELRTPDGSREFVGGAGLNVAVGLAVLGVRATLVAMVGDDADGQRIRGFLAEHDVALNATTGPFGTSRAVSDRTDGEPRYAFNAAAMSRRIGFDPAQRDSINAAHLVVVSCFPFDDAEQVAALGASVAGSSRRLLIDPNPREAMMHDRHAFVRGFEGVAANALLSKVGDDDAALLYGIPLEALRDRLLELGGGAVLATAGRQGASIVTREGVRADEGIAELPGAIVDTMGGGDATLASVVASLLRDGMPDTVAGAHAMLKQAMRVAAMTCRHEGALLRVPSA
ncbi:MAG TPA: PfkB family carbohydrate kinase [Humibacter sp.]|nr:PfkB family carbohydrate kinase [Humibacter sp.]